MIESACQDLTGSYCGQADSIGEMLTARQGMPRPGQRGPLSMQHGAHGADGGAHAGYYNQAMLGAADAYFPPTSGGGRTQSNSNQEGNARQGGQW